MTRKKVTVSSPTVNGGDDIWVTRNGIANSRNKLLCEGQEVEFSLTRGSYGIAANDVIAL